MVKLKFNILKRKYLHQPQHVSDNNIKQSKVNGAFRKCVPAPMYNTLVMTHAETFQAAVKCWRVELALGDKLFVDGFAPLNTAETHIIKKNNRETHHLSHKCNEC